MSGGDGCACEGVRTSVHWETQYRKVVMEPSCIRKPDTGQQADGLSCFESGAPIQRKACKRKSNSLGPFDESVCHVSDWSRAGSSRFPFSNLPSSRPVLGLLMHDSSFTIFPYWVSQYIRSFRLDFQAAKRRTFRYHARITNILQTFLQEKRAVRFTARRHC